MTISFYVKTRKDGSVGIPKSVQRKMGLKPHTQMECVFDSLMGFLTMSPRTVACLCCGKAIMPGSSEHDPVMGTCPECTKKIESWVANGSTVRAAVRHVKDKTVNPGRRVRK